MDKECNLQTLVDRIANKSNYGEIKYKKFYSIVANSKIKGDSHTEEVINILFNSEVINKKSKRRVEVKGLL